MQRPHFVTSFAKYRYLAYLDIMDFSHATQNFWMSFPFQIGMNILSIAFRKIKNYAIANISSLLLSFFPYLLLNCCFINR